MKPLIKLASLFACALLLLEPTIATPIYYQVPFTYNSNMQAGGIYSNGHTFPQGNLTFAGIPFYIPESGDNYWNSYYQSGPNPRTLSIDVEITGVIEVHTLINTYWGTPGPNSYAAVEFIGSNGAYYRVDLIGNDHIRDYNQSTFTNFINGVTTVEVFNNGLGQRLDKQVFFLPADFKTQQLDTINIIDNGEDRLQRVFLAGLTVGAVPTSSVLGLLLTGLIAISAFRKNSTRMQRHTQ